MGSWKGSSVAVAAAVAVSAAFAAVASGSSLGQAASTVTVTAGKPSELAFTLSKKTAAKGLVTFTVTNKGKLSHDFKIAGKKTPLIKPGKTTPLKVTFAKAGKYSFLCTVPGHAAAGMKGVLTIK
jgi:uncharacterized cupredoxin-like copper-binding protein